MLTKNCFCYAIGRSKKGFICHNINGRIKDDGGKKVSEKVAKRTKPTEMVILSTRWSDITW